MNDLSQKRKQCEDDIRQCILEHLDKFYAETGLTPSRIDVEMINADTMEDVVKGISYNLLGNVRMRVEV